MGISVISVSRIFCFQPSGCLLLRPVNYLNPEFCLFKPMLSFCLGTGPGPAVFDEKLQSVCSDSYPDDSKINLWMISFSVHDVALI